MKKKILLVIVLLVSFLLVGCGDTKEPLNNETFKEKLELKGFTIVDLTDTMQTPASNIESYIVATSPNQTYNFEFFIYTNEAAAQSHYARERDKFGGQGQYTELNVGNFSKYTQICNGKYGLISRVGSTLLYTNLDNNYRNEVNEILKEIGY